MLCCNGGRTQLVGRHMVRGVRNDERRIAGRPRQRARRATMQLACRATAAEPGARPKATAGLFSQSWFPLCRSDELPPGQCPRRTVSRRQGRRVSGTRTVRARRQRVLSARRRGPVARLRRRRPPAVRVSSLGVRRTRVCVKTALGDPPPPTRASSASRRGALRRDLGLQWQRTALESAALRSRVRTTCGFAATAFPNFSSAIPGCSPRTPRHAAHQGRPPGAVRGGRIPHDAVDLGPTGAYATTSSLRTRAACRSSGRSGIRGTSVFWQEGPYGDFWLGGMVGFGLPRPGQHEVFAILALDAHQCGANDPQRVLEERFQLAEQLMYRTINEDRGHPQHDPLPARGVDARRSDAGALPAVPARLSARPPVRTVHQLTLLDDQPGQRRRISFKTASQLPHGLACGPGGPVTIHAKRKRTTHRIRPTNASQRAADEAVGLDSGRGPPVPAATFAQDRCSRKAKTVCSPSRGSSSAIDRREAG